VTATRVSSAPPAQHIARETVSQSIHWVWRGDELHGLGNLTGARYLIAVSHPAHTRTAKRWELPAPVWTLYEVVADGTRLKIDLGRNYDELMLRADEIEQDAGAQAWVDRPSPSAVSRAPVARMPQDDEVTGVRDFAAHFLDLIENERDFEEYSQDPRAAAIAAALGRVGVQSIHGILGHGSFGVAARAGAGRVVKITADPAEVVVGAALVGKSLPHVAAIYGSWFVRGVKVSLDVGWDEEEQEAIRGVHRVGVLVEQLLSPIGGEERHALTQFVWDWKERTGNTWKHYSGLSRQRQRDKLRGASDHLVRVLDRDAQWRGASQKKLFADVADAVAELGSVGVYAIDVHGGNVGWDEGASAYRVFDVGVGSPPPGARAEAVGPGVPGGDTRPERAERGQQLGWSFEVAGAIAPGGAEAREIE